MTEERITETETPTGNVHTTHTVVTDEGRGRGGSGWLIALILLVAAIAAVYFISQQSGAEVAKDNAVANAAESVSDAAGEVGSAAKEVVDGN